MAIFTIAHSHIVPHRTCLRLDSKQRPGRRRRRSVVPPQRLYVYVMYLLVPSSAHRTVMQRKRGTKLNFRHLLTSNTDYRLSLP